jgi:hypothetical protein
MRLEILNGLGQVVILPATRVLVTDDLGNPIAFAVTFHRDAASGREHTRVGHAGDKDFNAQMRMNGLTRTVLVTHLDTAAI